MGHNLAGLLWQSGAARGSAAADAGGIQLHFPIAFPNSIWALWPYLETDAVTAVFTTLSIMAKAVTPLQKQGNQLALLLINNTTTQGQLIASAQVPHETGITGIGWVALGY